MDSGFPVLQVALDLVQPRRAIQIAKEAVEGGADWIEAGTPLIKSGGMDILRALRAEFPDRVIVADLKTMDTGGFETEMAAKSGANVTTVMGCADDGTVMEAVRSGEQYGCKVMVDLLGVGDRVARAKELERMGVHYLCVHVSIDDQMMGRLMGDQISDLLGSTRLPVAVAGGITPETAKSLTEAGASIVIVGGGNNQIP